MMSASNRPSGRGAPAFAGGRNENVNVRLSASGSAVNVLTLATSTPRALATTESRMTVADVEVELVAVADASTSMATSPVMTTVTFNLIDTVALVKRSGQGDARQRANILYPLGSTRKGVPKGCSRSLPACVAPTTYAAAVNFGAHAAHARWGQNSGAAHAPRIHCRTGAVAHPTRVHSAAHTTAALTIQLAAQRAAQPCHHIDVALAARATQVHNTAAALGMTTWWLQ
jgi:hypothetical protein